MKMVLIVCPEWREEECIEAISKHGMHAYTILHHATGEGETGKKLGTRIWPGESALILMIIDDEKKDEVARVIQECRATLYSGEGIEGFVMPVEERL